MAPRAPPLPPPLIRGGNFQRSRYSRRPNKTYTRSKVRKCEIIVENVECLKKLGFKRSTKAKYLDSCTA